MKLFLFKLQAAWKHRQYKASRRRWRAGNVGR